jgi:Holliday junction DNA helicase RuvA
LQVKEDGITLFGFDTPKEKELFLKLISVSGVGPKLGISILAALSADDFAYAVATADVKRLSAVKGLGKKTAEKIVLELHGKISAAEVLGASGDDFTLPAQADTPAKLSAMDEEAVAALMGLGFTRAESTQAVKKAHDNGAKTVEEIIMRALQST